MTTRGITSPPPKGKKKWLLRDDFSYALAAGAVNGTLATPGPGLRAVVDTDDKLTISGGKANFTPHTTAAWGDPGYSLDLITRVAGRVFFYSVTPTQTDKYLKMGIYNSQTPGANDNVGVRFSIGGVIQVALDNTLTAQGIYTAGTLYKVAVIAKAAGGYVFIKGGTFTNWTLLSYGGTVTTDIFPTIINYTATFSADYIRIPDEKWLPRPLAYDTFTRADGALGSSESTGPDSQRCLPRVWTNKIGTTLISSNASIASVLDGGLAIATVDTGRADGVASLNLTRGTTSPGIVVRYVDANNYVFARHNGTNAQLIKVIAGTPTALVDAAAEYGAGRTLRVIYSATKFRLYYHGAFIGTEQTIADAAVQTSTLAGTIFDDTDSTADNFTVFARGQNDGHYETELNRLVSEGL